VHLPTTQCKFSVPGVTNPNNSTRRKSARSGNAPPCSRRTIWTWMPNVSEGEPWRMVWRVSLPYPTRVQTWWDSVDTAINIMDSTVFREQLHGVIVPWVLWRNTTHEQVDRNNKCVPSSLLGKWLCHKCDILIRGMPLCTHLCFQRRIHGFFSSSSLFCSLFSSSALRRVDNSEWRELWIARLIYSRSNWGPVLMGQEFTWGYPPIPSFLFSCHMTSVLNFDWVLIFI